MGKLFGHIAFGACVHACVNFCVPITTYKTIKAGVSKFYIQISYKTVYPYFFSLLSTILEL